MAEQAGAAECEAACVIESKQLSRPVPGWHSSPAAGTRATHLNCAQLGLTVFQRPHLLLHSHLKMLVGVWGDGVSMESRF